MTTKTIGTATRDYSTIQAWEDACPTNLVTSTQTWIGQCYNDSEFTAGISFAGITTSATYYIELTTATGQSFKDHANKLTNALKYNQSNGVAVSLTGGYANLIDCNQPNLKIRNLQLKKTNGGETTRTLNVASTDFLITDCIIQNQSDDVAVLLTHNTHTMVNCHVVKSTSNGTGGGVALQYGSRAYNCTSVRTSDAAAAGPGFSSYSSNNIVKNCATFGFTTGYSAGGWDTTNSSNNATDASSAPGSAAQTSLTYANQFENTTDASMDWRPKTGNNLQSNGTRDATNTSDLDIIGQSRSITTPTIGCWEFVSGGGDSVTINPITWQWENNSVVVKETLDTAPTDWAWFVQTGVLVESVQASPTAWEWAVTTGGIVEGSQDILTTTPVNWEWAQGSVSFVDKLEGSPGSWEWVVTTGTQTESLETNPVAWEWTTSTGQLLGTTAVDTNPVSWEWEVTTGLLVQVIPEVGGTIGGKKDKHLKLPFYDKGKKYDSRIDLDEVYQPAKSKSDDPVVDRDLVSVDARSDKRIDGDIDVRQDIKSDEPGGRLVSELLQEIKGQSQPVSVIEFPAIAGEPEGFDEEAAVIMLLLAA